MPTNIVETPVKGTVLSVPVGSDKRKASTLLAAWQAIGNRLNFLEAFYELIKPLTLGGTINPAAALVINAVLTVGNLTAGFITAARLQGVRNLRLAAPTASASYNHASGIDVVFVVRSGLAAGTTTITVSDAGRQDGDSITIVVGGVSSGKNVDIQLPSASPISTGDTDTVRYTFMRAPGGGPWTQIW